MVTAMTTFCCLVVVRVETRSRQLRDATLAMSRRRRRRPLRVSHMCSESSECVEMLRRRRRNMCRCVASHVCETCVRVNEWRSFRTPRYR